MTLRSQHIIVVRVGAALALWLFSLQASAQEVPNKPEWYLELGVGRTDNLNRDPDELESDIGKVGVGFAGRTDRRWLRAALGGDLEYRRYEIDSSEEPLEDDDEVLGTAGLQLELHAIPDRIQWDFRADYGQSRIDPLGAVGPSNRQRTTSYATGPKFGLPLGSRTLLKLGGEVADQEFEVTQDLDGRSTNILLELERQLDEVTKISLVGDKREIEYDLDGQMHDIESLMLKYNRELASGEALVSIGAGRVSVNGVEADPVAVGQLVWKRDVGVRSGFEICVGREITDAGSAFESAGVAIGCPGDLSSLESVARTATNREQGVVSTTNPLLRSGGSASYSWTGDLGTFRATFSLTQDRFENDETFDNDSTILEIAASRNFAQHWRVDLSARMWLQDFIEQGEENEDRFLRVAISRSFARKLRLSLSYELNRRVGGVAPFDANDVFLTVGWDFGR